ncbi:MAG TPA: valine--tRNA ligase, partial [Kofleriaceae bacterium]
MTTSSALPKQYDPSEVEPRWLGFWLENGYFHADETSPTVPFAITLPPPNVTGSLHIGHALGSTMQDILIRWRRMQGFNAMWMPGVDHASIAVHVLLEKALMKREKLTRFDLGREKFLERAWAWKEHSGGRIKEQEKLMGFSLDWPRERFTMDEKSNRAVTEAFVRLYEDGLIFRAKRMINWDPLSETVVSDLEVDTVEENGHLWELRYPIAGGGEVVVATTRPETMLGDTGVAVHPSDERYQGVVGKHVELPLTGRTIPIVADAFVDPAFGTGAVKVTPAHDANDFEAAQRTGLAIREIIDRRGRMTGDIPAKYLGMTVDECRKAVVEDLEAGGFLVSVKDYKVPRARAQRGGAVIEPMLMDQWWVKAGPLAEKALAAVEAGKTKFVPEMYAKTFASWMLNIRDWCISRQLWWGHRIPAWHCQACAHITVSRTAPADCAKCGGAVVQDDDVLDTWFSSGLWPFSTLGWPEKTRDLATFYPNNVLVTAPDIIFFWVARMMMMGLHFMGDVPFRTVYIHALVRDEHGQKMSKSKGNVIDPLELIDKYGADALRFTLVAQAGQGRDIKMSEQRVEGYRNFATKLWNAARFCEMNGCVAVPDFDPRSVRQNLNRWIIGRLVAARQAVDLALEGYRYDAAAGALYQFAWGEFCDWHLEFAKPIFQGEDEAAKAETRAVTAWVLGQLLHLMHPFMPFITEELWTQVGPKGSGQLMTAHWPEVGNDLIDARADADLSWVIRIVSDVRALRAEMNVPPAAQVTLLVKDANDATKDRIAQYGDLVRRLARAQQLDLITTDGPKGAAQ